MYGPLGDPNFVQRIIDERHAAADRRMVAGRFQREGRVQRGGCVQREGHVQRDADAQGEARAFHALAAGRAAPRGPGHHVGQLAALALILAIIVTGLGFAMADAASLSAKWQAQIGSHGANGRATIQVLSTGPGSLSISLKGLAHSTTYSAALSRGTCARPSSRMLSLASVKTTAAGTFVRISKLTTAQVALVNRTGVIIRFVAGSHVFCGAFANVTVAPPAGPDPAPPPPGSPAPAPPPVPPSAVAATVAVGYAPFDVAITSNAVWVTSADNTVSRIDPSTNSVLSNIQVGTPGDGLPTSITVGDDGDLWVSVSVPDGSDGFLPGRVVRVDPVSGQVKATIPVGRFATDSATCAGSVWVTNYLDHTVSRIDEVTATAATLDLLLPNLAGVACGEGSVWITSERAATVIRLDPADNHVIALISTLAAPEGVVVAGGAVWVANFGHQGQADGLLSRIDPATNQVVQTVVVGKNPIFVASGGGRLWVAMTGEPTIVEVDVLANTVVARLPIGGTSWGIAAADHVAWAVQPNTAGAKATPPQAGTATRINF